MSQSNDKKAIDIHLALKELGFIIQGRAVSKLGEKAELVTDPFFPFPQAFMWLIEKEGMTRQDIIKHEKFIEGAKVALEEIKKAA